MENETETLAMPLGIKQGWFLFDEILIDKSDFLAQKMPTEHCLDAMSGNEFHLHMSF